MPRDAAASRLECTCLTHLGEEKMSTGVAGVPAHVARHTGLWPSEGLRAGFVGATAIWLWLVVIDLIEGMPMHTSGVLGRDLLGIIVPGASTPLWADVLAFSILHYALWSLLGTLLVRAIAADGRQPGVLIFASFLLILLQLAVLVTTAVLAQGALQRHAWPAILGGHLIGLLTAGLYLRHRHHHLWAMLVREGDE
jgi:hypothetical protein